MGRLRNPERSSLRMAQVIDMFLIVVDAYSKNSRNDGPLLSLW